MNRLHANLLLLIAAAIWGTAFVAQQTGMEDVGALTFTWTRFLLGGLVVLPFAVREWRVMARVGRRLAGRDLLGIVATGLVLFLAAVLQQIGLGDTTVTNAGFLTSIYVALVPLIGFFALRSRPHWSVWPGAAGCVLGTYLLGGGQLSGLGVGDLWVIGSAVFWALHVLMVGFFCQRSDAPLALACLQFLVCAAASALAAPLLGETLRLEGLIAAGPEILYAGVLSVGVAYTFQVIGQRRAQAAPAAIILSTEAVFAAAAGALMQGERLNAVEGMGCALILASVIAVQVLPLIRRRPRVA